MFRLAVICGGPSAERGISLNSARSVLDHVSPQGVEVVPIYFNQRGDAYAISPSQLYSNTPSDFDFKLKRESKPLSKKELVEVLKSVDLAFPAIHGAFGEDGELQTFLEQQDIPFTGPSSKACQRMFDKYQSAQELRALKFDTIASLLVSVDDKVDKVRDFFKIHKLRRAIVKPTSGGSSIDVYSVTTAEQAYDIAMKVAPKYKNQSVVIEPFCEGVEFTVIVLEGKDGKPVALVPTEIETKYDDGAIFDYRKKYLATNQAAYHTPPRFIDLVIDEIRAQAEKIFTTFGMRDFVRLDGWVLNDGKIVFSDLNPISGMEQNSFLFQQSTRVGMTHADTLLYVIQSACRRYGIQAPVAKPQKKSKQRVNVLFGGNTAERQVSVMSGTNIWLKLRASETYAPEAFLLDHDLSVWKLSYALALNHTVEEMIIDCRHAKDNIARMTPWVASIRKRLGFDAQAETIMQPIHCSLDEFITLSAERDAFVFLGLHGGMGEGGYLQEKLQSAGVPFNGSHANAARLCMDKYETGARVRTLNDPYILSAEKKLYPTDVLLNHPDIQKFWMDLVTELQAQSLIVKPQGDGCSAGIVRLFSGDELQRYLDLIRGRAPFIPANTFKGQQGIIEMPSADGGGLMFEPFIVTDKISTQDVSLDFEKETGWIELTIGVRERAGKYHALNPSITIAEGNVLSLEEKFQGGTGVNITPPPAEIVSADLLKQTRARMEKVAQVLGIQNYSRIDLFLNVDSGKIIVIEANTLPGLTPSTVIYHQALAESPPQTPRQFLENIITDAIADAKASSGHNRKVV